MKVTPHVAQNTSGRSSAIDGRTTRHAGYAVSQRIRKRIEEAFGWIKTIAGQDKTKLRGCERGRLGLHLRRRRLQSDAAAQAAGGAGMSAPMNCQLIGRWRIVEADIWDRDYLDLCGPGDDSDHRAHGRGEIAFGALQAGLDIEYSRLSVGFNWDGSDEGDQVLGDGSAELLRGLSWGRSRNGWPTAGVTPNPFQEFRTFEGSTRRVALWHFLY